MQAFVLALTVTGMMSTVLIAPAVPDLLRDLGQSHGMAGVVMGAGTLPGIVAAPIIGVLADRYGRRRVLVPCLATFGLFGLGAAIAPSIEILLGLRLLQGIGAASLINLAIVLIGDHWSGRRRVTILGRNTAVLTASVAVLAPVGGALTGLGGWRLTFVPYGVGFALLVPTMLLLGRSPVAGERPALVKHVLASFGRARDVEIRTPLLVGMILLMASFGLVLTVLPLHLEQHFRAGAGLTGSVIAVFGLAATVVALGAGAVHRRWTVPVILLGGSALLMLGYPIVGLAGTILLVVLGVLITGTAEGLLVPTLQGTLAAAARANDRGAIMALWGSTVRMGQTLGPLLAGAAAVAIGTGPSLWIGGCAVGLLMVVLVHSGMVRRVPAAERRWVER